MHHIVASKLLHVSLPQQFRDAGLEFFRGLSLAKSLCGSDCQLDYLKEKMGLFTAHNSELELSPAEPHFDEEATLLSAQPVVPLEKIVAERRSSKSLIFGLAILFSLIVGAFGGALIYKQAQKESTAILDSAIPGAEGIGTDESVAASAAPESVAEAGTGTLPDSNTVPAESKLVPPLRHVEAPPVVTRQKNFPSQVDDKELRRADRIEDRILRRRSERQAQKEARRNRDRADDVLRIREIFEGSRRP